MCACVAVLGVLGLLDYDAVEISNLHRQILHCEERVGVTKTHSAEKAITRFTDQSRGNCVLVNDPFTYSLNSSVICHTHHILLTSENAMDIIKQ